MSEGDDRRFLSDEDLIKAFYRLLRDALRRIQADTDDKNTTNEKQGSNDTEEVSKIR